MAGILGAQNEVEARRRAAEEARADVAFGQRFGDRLAGYSKGADTYLKGGLGDLIGNISGFFGDEDTAARLAFESDELYRRGGEFFDKGLAGGQKYLDESSIPITPQERSARESALAEQAVKQAQAAENTQAGEFAGMGTPLVDPMASGLDVEYQAENARQLQETIDAIAAKGGKGRGSTNEQIGERDAFNQVLDMKAKKEAAKNDPMGDYSGEEPTVDLFMQAMADGNVAQGREQPKAESREDLLEKYKQEFADATGVDISGKPDTSQALMAMGLSMMQNRAGKGFNVGKMLSAVGEAGEKAMPELSRARQEAKAAKVAAGKYALGQIEKGESAAAAIAAEDKAFQRERYLKLLQMDADFEKERIKAGGKVAEVKNVKADKVINGLTVQRGRGATGAVFVFPQDALRDTAGALKSVNGALGTVDTMTDLATQIANEESPTFSLLRDRVNTALVGAGLADAEVVFGDAKIGNEQQMKIFQQSIITQFKRMLTQETGNGISAKDVEQINLMLGQIDLLGNPQGSLKRLAEIKTLFMGKRRAIRGVLDELQDPELYPTEGEYTKNMELYPTLIEGNTAYRTVNGQGSPIDVADPK